MTQRGRFVLGALLLALALLSWRTLSLEGEKRRVSESYDRARRELSQLVQEHGLLENELSGAQTKARSADEEVLALRTELARLQQRLTESTAQLSSLQQEREILRRENLSLAQQLELIRQEKQQLEGRLSSLKELQLAMRDVKGQMRDRRWASWKARIEVQRGRDQELLASGNRGYLVRDGKPTFASGTRMQVRVLAPETP